MSERPVGVFDSGLGGASVLREALRLLPNENYIYYGDSGNAPYGDKSDDDITALTMACIDKLMAMNVKAILIACNTATAASVSKVRQLMNQYSMPIISIEPAIKPACALPGTGKVFMMATLATTRLNRYLALQARMPDPSRVINIPCPGIVERVEAGIFDDDAYDDLFDKYFAPYVGTEVDAIVLGCTHYPFIKGAFARNAKRYLKGDCALIDGSVGTVRQLERILDMYKLKSPCGTGKVEFHTSGNEAVLKPIFEKLLKQDKI